MYAIYHAYILCHTCIKSIADSAIVCVHMIYDMYAVCSPIIIIHNTSNEGQYS